MSTFNYPILSASFTEAATTPDGGGLPAQVKVVAGVDTSTGLVHVLKTDSAGQLFTTATFTEGATGAENASATGVLRKLVAGVDSGTGQIHALKVGADGTLATTATMTEQATAAESGATPALLKVIAGVDDGTGLVHALKVSSDGTLQTSASAEAALAAEGAAMPAQVKVIGGKDGSTLVRAVSVSASGVVNATISNIPTTVNAANPVFTRLTDGSVSYDAAKSTQLPATIGQKTSANSTSVVIASDNTPTIANIPATVSATTPVFSRLTDGTTAYDAAKSTQLPTTLGQTTAANSLSVAIASNNTVAVTDSVATAATGGAAPALYKVIAGQDSGNLIRPIKVDTSGVIQTASVEGATTTEAGVMPAVVKVVAGKDSGNLARVISTSNTGVINATISNLSSSNSASSPVFTRLTDGTTAYSTVTGTQLPSVLGQNAMANSLSVAIASNQPALSTTKSEPNVLPSMAYVDFASTPLTTSPYNILLNGNTVGTKILWYSTSGSVFILNRPGGSIMYISAGSSGYIPIYIGNNEQLTINTITGTISVGSFYLVVIP